MVYLLIQVTDMYEFKGAVEDFRNEKALQEEGAKLVVVCDGVAESVLNEVKDDNILIERFRVPLGLGASLSAGLSRVANDSTDENDIVISCHSPFIKDKALQSALLAAINEGDVAIASRYSEGEGYQNFSILRKFFSQKVNALMHKEFPLKGIADYTVFLRAYRVGLIKRAIRVFGPFGLVQSRGHVAGTELLIKLSFLTQKIAEVYYPFDFELLTSRAKVGICKTINEYMVLVAYLKRLKAKVDTLPQHKQEEMLV